MPRKLERKLKRRARRKGMTTNGKLTKRGRKYVYGTMRKAGWKPRSER